MSPPALKRKPSTAPAQGSGPNSPARGSVQVPRPQSRAALAGLCGERSIRNSTGRRSPPLPSTQAVPKPGSGSGSPRQPWGTQGSSRAPALAPEQAGQEHSEAEAAAWKNAHSGRMPSNKFIVFYYIFPFLHLIPIPHIQTLLSERK